MWTTDESSDESSVSAKVSQSAARDHLQEVMKIAPVSLELAMKDEDTVQKIIFSRYGCKLLQCFA